MLSSEMGAIHWDEIPMLTKKEARPEYIDWFFKRIEETRGKTIAKGNRDRYLRSAGDHNDEKFTNAGILFFTEAMNICTSPKLGKLV